MTDEQIVEAAKSAEKKTEFGELVHSQVSRGVNSAYGIGFLEGAEWARAEMMLKAVEIGTTEICWVPDGDRVFPTFDPPVEDLLMPGIISQKFNECDKVRLIVIPNTDEK